MNIGDKVRLLRGQEEGIVTRFLDGGLVEVEIEDGFQIPVLKNELVVVASEEAKYFRRQEVPSRQEKKKREDEPFVPRKRTGEVKKELVAASGVFFAFVAINDQKLSLHIINNTDLAVPFSVGEEKDLNFKGVAHGVLDARNSSKVGEYTTTTFEQWPAFLVQLLFHRNGYFTHRPPMVRRLQFKANTFFKNQQQAPVLNKTSHLFQLDTNEAQRIEEPPAKEKAHQAADTGLQQEETAKGTSSLDPQALAEKMYDNTPPEEVQAGKRPSVFYKLRPPSEIDLHIEALTPDYEKMNSGEMIALQLKVFEENLDQAIASGMDEITFIHGRGAGVLRNAIHKHLSAMPNIRYFKDSKKDKFGFGATTVQIS